MINLQIFTNESCHNDDSKVLEGLGTAAAVPAHAGGLYAAAGAHPLPSPLSSVPPPAGACGISAGAHSGLFGAPHVPHQNVGCREDTGPCPKVDRSETLQED